MIVLLREDPSEMNVDPNMMPIEGGIVAEGRGLHTAYRYSALSFGDDAPC